MIFSPAPPALSSALAPALWPADYLTPSQPLKRPSHTPITPSSSLNPALRPRIYHGMGNLMRTSADKLSSQTFSHVNLRSRTTAVHDCAKEPLSFIP